MPVHYVDTKKEQSEYFKTNDTIVCNCRICITEESIGMVLAIPIHSVTTETKNSLYYFNTNV